MQSLRDGMHLVCSDILPCPHVVKPYLRRDLSPTSKISLGANRKIYSRYHTVRSENQCWRVVGEAPLGDRVIRASLQNIVPEALDVSDQDFSCKPQFHDRRGLLLYDGEFGWVRACSRRGLWGSSRGYQWGLGPLGCVGPTTWGSWGAGGRAAGLVA